jgi:acetyl coenzyme A synthetase (ADP forming)-like protein
VTALRSSLDSFFRPQSVAVIGASVKSGSVGNILMRNLLENPFGGVVFPINPTRRAVQGVHSYPNLAAVPEKVELAVIATPAATVPTLVRDCVENGVPAAIIISAGFAELGAEGRKLEDEIRGIARGKIRIVGPNCLGIIHPPSNLNASFAASMAPRGQVALLSQSGAICTAILDWARQAHVGFSSFVSVGSMLDVDFADLIDHFADDPATRSIVLYMESIGHVSKFLSAARSASRAKHVIVVKAGRHEAGARAAASHIGALTGADAVFDAAIRRAGVLRVTTIPDLFDMAKILAMQPPPSGPALAIITNAGGPGVMAADALLLGGGQLASLHPETLAALNASLPPLWSHANPIDLLGGAKPQCYRLAVEACARDPNVQGLLVLLTPQAMTYPTETARQLLPFARLPNKPLLACWMGGESVREGIGLLNTAGIPTFSAPEPAIRAFLHMVQYRRNQELLYQTPEALPENGSPDTPGVQRIFQRVRASGRTLLTEVESKEVLAAYGVPVATKPSEGGYELIIGSSIDHQFGPVILFGSGGILVEVFKDQALGLPPLNRTLARRLMERTKIYEALQGARGHKAVNLDALENLLARFSQLVVDFPEIQEVNLNPVLATSDRVVALHARIVLRPADQPANQSPRLAIHPYPNQYIATFRLHDGREAMVRPIRPEDEPLIIAMHAAHSENTIRMRFFSMVKTLSRESLIRLCHLDYDREMALAAVLHENGEPYLLGVSRYYLNPETGEAEFALVVSDAYQRQGLGRHLMQRLIDIARERGVERLVGQVLAENTPMLHLMQSLGFSAPALVENNVVRVELDLKASGACERPGESNRDVPTSCST